MRLTANSAKHKPLPVLPKTELLPFEQNVNIPRSISLFQKKKQEKNYFQIVMIHRKNNSAAGKKDLFLLQGNVRKNQYIHFSFSKKKNFSNECKYFGQILTVKIVN